MPETPITDVLNVAVPVTDQDRALAFWVEALGLEVRMDAELAPGFRWIEVGPPGGATAVALVEASEGNEAGRDTGLRLGTPDAAGLHRALAARGAAVGELLAWDTAPPMFSFRDPDGNTVYVVEAA